MEKGNLKESVKSFALKVTKTVSSIKTARKGKE
jgi:hypothetical protein